MLQDWKVPFLGNSFVSCATKTKFTMAASVCTCLTITKLLHNCNWYELYDHENMSTHFRVICGCNILMGNLLL